MRHLRLPAGQRIPGRSQRTEPAAAARADEVYSAFARAITEYRRAQITRWRKAASEGWTDSEAARDLYSKRSVAIHDRYRVLLIADDPEIEKLATAALDSAGTLQYATDPDDLGARGDECKLAVERFVLRARRQLELPDQGASTATCEVV